MEPRGVCLNHLLLRELGDRITTGENWAIIIIIIIIIIINNNNNNNNFIKVSMYLALQ